MPAPPSSLLSAFLLFGQVGTEASETRLLAAAAASPRPIECSGATDPAEPSTRFWQRARRPWLAGYCSLLAFGYARLSEDPSHALKVARRLKSFGEVGGDADVLEGRALLLLNQPREAWTAFGRARASSSMSLRTPAQLHAFAVAGAMTGHLDEALDAYRELASRTELLSNPEESVRIYIEAGLVAMRAPKGTLEEALGYLGEVRTEASPLREWALGFQALLLDRQGRREQAEGLLAELELPGELDRFAEHVEEETSEGAVFQAINRHLPLIYRPDLHALLGLWLAEGDPESAREHWEQYLRMVGAADKFRAHAEAKTKLGKGSRR